MWFGANRETYQQHVEEPFTQLLDEVTARLQGTPVPLRGGTATTFRMNRDVRFSADTSPYSTHRSGLLTPSGTKTESGGLVYLQLDARGGQLAGGLYKPSTARLEPLRRAVLDHPDRVGSVLTSLTGTGHALDETDRVKTMPRGYAGHADHPYATVIRLKQLVVSESLPTAAWLDDTVADRVVAFTLAIQPLLAFIRSHSD